MQRLQSVSPHYSVFVTTTARLYGGVGRLSQLFRDLHEPAFGNAGMWTLQLARNLKETQEANIIWSSGVLADATQGSTFLAQSSTVRFVSNEEVEGTPLEGQQSDARWAGARTRQLV
jgi:hypothetical protein